MFGILSKRHYAGFKVEVGYSVDVHAVVKDEGVCPDDGPRSARRSQTLLPWMCAAIARANPRSMAFCEVQDSQFNRMFVAYSANINGFKLGCCMILFFDNCHLSGQYKGTMLAVCALDVDNVQFYVRNCVI